MSVDFAAVRASLGSLFITHKIDLGMADHSDAEIIAQVNDIAAKLMLRLGLALEHGDEEWLDRHRWWCDACERLLKDPLTATREPL